MCLGTQRQQEVELLQLGSCSSLRFSRFSKNHVTSAPCCVVISGPGRKLPSAGSVLPRTPVSGEGPAATGVWMGVGEGKPPWRPVPIPCPPAAPAPLLLQTNAQNGPLNGGARPKQASWELAGTQCSCLSSPSSCTLDRERQAAGGRGRTSPGRSARTGKLSCSEGRAPGTSQ